MSKRKFKYKRIYSTIRFGGKRRRIRIAANRKRLLKELALLLVLGSDSLITMRGSAVAVHASSLQSLLAAEAAEPLFETLRERRGLSDIVSKTLSRNKFKLFKNIASNNQLLKALKRRPRKRRRKA